MIHNHIVIDYRIPSSDQLIDCIISEKLFVYDAINRASKPSTVKLHYRHGITVTKRRFVSSGCFGLNRQSKPVPIVANIWTDHEVLGASGNDWYVEVWGKEMFPEARRLISRLASRLHVRATIVLKSETPRMLY